MRTNRLRLAGVRGIDADDVLAEGLHIVGVLSLRHASVAPLSILPLDVRVLLVRTGEGQ